MEAEQVRVGQRIRVNVPGVGDHGQVGTIKRVQGGKCYIHLDWDQRQQHVVVFYAADLERVPDTDELGRGRGAGAGSQARVTVEL